MNCMNQFITSGSMRPIDRINIKDSYNEALIAKDGGTCDAVHNL